MHNGDSVARDWRSRRHLRARETRLLGFGRKCRSGFGGDRLAPQQADLAYLHVKQQHPRVARQPNAAGADSAAVNARRNPEGENHEDRRHQLYRHRLAVAGGRHAARHRHGRGAQFRARAAARPHQPGRLRQPRDLRHGVSPLAGAERLAARALSVLDLRHRLADHADRPLLHADERTGGCRRSSARSPS